MKYKVGSERTLELRPVEGKRVHKSGTYRPPVATISYSIMFQAHMLDVVS